MPKGENTSSTANFLGQLSNSSRYLITPGQRPKGSEEEQIKSYAFLAEFPFEIR